MWNLDLLSVLKSTITSLTNDGEQSRVSGKTVSTASFSHNSCSISAGSPEWDGIELKKFTKFVIELIILWSGSPEWDGIELKKFNKFVIELIILWSGSPCETTTMESRNQANYITFLEIKEGRTKKMKTTDQYMDHIGNLLLNWWFKYEMYPTLFFDHVSASMGSPINKGIKGLSSSDMSFSFIQNSVQNQMVSPSQTLPILDRYILKINLILYKPELK